MTLVELIVNGCQHAIQHSVRNDQKNVCFINYSELVGDQQV